MKIESSKSLTCPSVLGTGLLLCWSAGWTLVVLVGRLDSRCGRQVGLSLWSAGWTLVLLAGRLDS